MQQNYEIRIVQSGQGPVFYACPHWSDYAAIRRAQLLAKAEDEVEVWRGDICIFARNSGFASHHAYVRNSAA
jgi:hypothetical protein